MKAVLFATLVLVLVGCSAPVVSDDATLVTPTPAPTATSTSVPTPTPAPAVSFNIGVPAGDAYYPYGLTVDAARNVAYVHHADSVEKRPVISVVDIAAGKVTRLIRLNSSRPGGLGRLFLAPDGKRLYFQENQDDTLSQIDVASGSVKKLLDGVNQFALSQDGRLLFVANQERLAAYLAADLNLGKLNPTWEAAGNYVQLAVGGDRLLAATWEQTGALVSFDAATGRELARGDARESVDAVAAGPAGGWAITVGGERPSLTRYAADLQPIGETGILYASNVTYDAARSRYLVGGQRYGEAEPAGHPVILAVDANDGRLLAEQRWPGRSAPTAFVPWGTDRLVAVAEGGVGVLSVIDAAPLALVAAIPTGVRAEDLIVDDGSQTLYVADDLGRIHVLGLPGGAERGLWEGSAPFAIDIKNSRLYVNRPAGVAALDAQTGALLAQFPQAGFPAPDPQANVVYLVDRGVTMYDRAGKRLGTLPSTFPVERGFSPNPYAYAAYVNPITGHVAVIMGNGVPGSNGGSYLRIYPRQSDQAVTPSAPHSFVLDVLADRQGNWWVAYSPVRNQDAVQVLSADGQQLRRLDRRAGYLALDQGKDELFLFSDGLVTRLTASTLAPVAVFEGPAGLSGLAYSVASRTAYVIFSNSAEITALPLGALSTVDLRPVPGRPAPEAANEGLTVTTNGGKRLIVARFGEIYRSADGVTWERLLPGLQMNYGYLTAADGALFVAGQGQSGGEGVWRSTDGGSTWAWLAAGLSDLAAAGPVLALGRDQAYVVNQGQGLLRWNAGARKWDVVSTPGRAGQWGSFVLVPDGALFRANEGSLERSADRGSTWTKLGATDKTGDVIGYSALYTVTHTLFSVVRTDYRITGLQRSTDGGKTWQKTAADPLLNFDGYQPEMATGFDRTYLLLRTYTGDSKLLRTKDYGETWEGAPAGTVVGVDHLAVDPLDARLWLGVKGGVKAVDPEKLRWTKVSAAQPSATPTPRATLTPAPAPTATAAPCRQALTGGDAEINARNLGLGCPKGQAATIQMARQRFQYGQMIWRSDVTAPQVYVLYNDGRWAAYPDAWKEGDPADDPALTPPSGLQQPVRGFGKVWREQLGGSTAAVGWAIEPEAGVQGQAQDWDHGTVIRFGGEVIVLLDRGEWK